MTDNVHFMSKTVECLTPKHILDAVGGVMGWIDLDPCAETHDNPNVPATTHYTKEDNGLALDWGGKVFMNPPYGRQITSWLDKLIIEYWKGYVTEAIALLPARTDTKWWEYLRHCPVCFIKGRLKFSCSVNSAPFPSAVAYFGTNRDRFIAAFNDLGTIWIEVRHT